MSKQSDNGGEEKDSFYILMVQRILGETFLPSPTKTLRLKDPCERATELLGTTKLCMSTVSKPSSHSGK